MSKHTLGPWTVRLASHSGSYYVEAPSPTAAKWLVSEVSGRGRQTNLANAHLIAAAPDLYAVAKEMREACAYIDSGISQEMRDRINAAIAKAEGGAR